ncbi:hypothetical protein ACEN9X_09300 [Mucilaginibacter sp. Mucisp86]|uniref:hypothetical protein n=1 Tax=Mucilaginibacter sp. Mucisp86 TaxID=3243060 RepID=UPI0039B6616C
MQERLLQRLNDYIRLDHPDLLIRLAKEHKLSGWLIDKVKTVELLIEQLIAEGKSLQIIEERCLEILTMDLRPSRFAYISELLEEDFEWDYYQMREAGTTMYEVIGMIDKCRPIFDELGFCEANKNNPAIRRAVMAVLQHHLQPE